MCHQHEEWRDPKPWASWWVRSGLLRVVEVTVCPAQDRESGREFTCPVLSDESHLKVRLGQVVCGGHTEMSLSLSSVGNDKGLL